MSKAIFPVVNGREVRVFNENNYMVYTFYVNHLYGQPQIITSGNTLIVQYPNGNREICKFDDNGNYLSHTMV